MRFSAGPLSVICLASSLQISAATNGKPVKVAVALPPKVGVKTPGIQIPFAQIKADATLATPDNPTWMYFATAGGGRGSGGRGGGRGAGAPAAGVPAAGANATPAAPGAGAGEPPAGDLYVPSADKVLKFETKNNKAAEPIAGIKKPCGGAVNVFASLWIPSCGDGTLLRLDPRTLKPKATIASGAADVKGSIVATTDSIWLITDSKQTIARIDPEQDAVVAEFRVPPGCGNMLFAEAAIWMTCTEQGKVLKINPATNLIDKRIDVGAKPMALASGQGSVWVLCGKEGKLDRIDPKTDKVTKTVDLGTPEVTGSMAYGEGYLWVTTTGFPLTRVDISETDKERVAQQFWGDGGGALLTSTGVLWLSNLNNGTVSRIDPKLVLATLAE